MGRPWDSCGRNRRLVILLSGGLGDHLLMSPFVRHFRRSGRYEHIVCALPTKAVGLYDRCPHIDQLVPCPGNDLWLWGLPEDDRDVFSPLVRVHLRPGCPWEPFPEFHFGLNQGKASVVRQVAAFHGIRLDDEALEIFVAPEDALWAQRTMGQWTDRPVILLSYRTQLSEKAYPVCRWQRIVNGLNRQGVVLELSHAGSDLTGTEVVSPMPTLRQSAALFRLCDCILTVDSFAGHLAAAVGTPAVVLFGPTNPAVFGHPDHRAIRSGNCAVCADTARLRLCTDRFCIEGIAPEDVVKAACDLLAL